MSRSPGVYAGFWDDSWDEEFEKEHQSDCEDDAVGEDLDAYGASSHSELFVASLTRCTAVGGKAKRGGRSLDVTHSVFAAMELDRSVCDVAEEISFNAAQEERRVAQHAVSSVVESLVAAVELEIECDLRRQQQRFEDTPRRPMCASTINKYFTLRMLP